ncbi:MAG: hypothetical protein DHS20C06_01110 [Hyphobacterium sp.]|nr:MAG: hypothetical protein DHS20C06_01110 [Hyphobacterium sp.]
MESLLDRTNDRFGLVIHIGCSETAGRMWQRRADNIVMVEPDPLRADAIRTWLDEGGKGMLVEAAVADRRGEGTFRRTSFGDMNSLRVPTGALTLFPGLQSLETVPVKLILARDLINGRNLESIEGRTCLVIDAPSEVLVALADLVDADVLEKIDDIILNVAEIPLHEGGADRKYLERWLVESGLRLDWETNSVDPDIRYARVEPDWKARNTRNDLRVLELTEIVSDLRDSNAKILGEAQANYAALEKSQQDRDALKEEVEALKAAKGEALEAAQANYTALEKSQQDRDALRQEIEGLRQSYASSSEEAQANYAALEKSQQDRDALKEEVEALTAAKGEALDAAQANYAALEKSQQDRDALKEEVEVLKIALNKASEEAQGAQRIRSELELMRDDNRLSLRIQRIAQADLAELQDRYGSLADEKRKLEDFLDELAEKVQESMSAKAELPLEKKAKTTRSRARTSSKPAKKSSQARSE